MPNKVTVGRPDFPNDPLRADIREVKNGFLITGRFGEGEWIATTKTEALKIAKELLNQ